MNVFAVVENFYSELGSEIRDVTLYDTKEKANEYVKNLFEESKICNPWYTSDNYDLIDNTNNDLAEFSIFEKYNYSSNHYAVYVIEKPIK